MPVLTKDHTTDGFCSITGGYVVRDPGLPTLLGRYLYVGLLRRRAAHGRPRRARRRRRDRAAGVER